jgi:hypothetical protein
MQDLTKITTAFGLLDDETKAALIAHCGPFEHYAVDLRWYKVDGIRKYPHVVYRVKTMPVIGSVVFHGVDKTFHSLHPELSTGHAAGSNRMTFTFPTRDGLHVPGVYTSPDGLQIVVTVAK